MADLYSTLGVARGADEPAIKKAYRKLAKELHPDRNKDNPAASARFSEVTQAYDLLSDKDKRAQYDRGEIDEQGNPKAPFGYGAGPGGGMGGGGFRSRAAPGGGGFSFEGDPGDFGNIFDDLFSGGGNNRRTQGGFGGFGARRPPPQKGADVAYRLAVDFEDAAALKPQRITLANGKTIDLKITADAVGGTPMKLGGQGEEGPGGKGDALVTLEIRGHRHFTRDGDDVRLDLPISLREAVEGGKVRAPTVEGAVMLTVPPGASSGKVLRLKGRGFHRKDGARGDQLVTLMIHIPADDSALQAFVADWTPPDARGEAGL